MPTPAAADLKPGRARLWSSWLWILAAILGAGVLWSAFRLIHDERLRRESLRALAQDKATEIASHGTQRFRLLVSEAFGSVWSDAGTEPRADAVAQLARNQVDRDACRCRETLPVTRYFRFDASAAGPRLTTSAGSGSNGVADSTVARIASAQWARANGQASQITDLQVVGGHAILTLTRPAEWAGGARVYGAVMPVPALAAALFGGIPRNLPGDSLSRSPFMQPVFIHGAPGNAHVIHRAMHDRLVQLDTLGLSVATGAGAVFGSVADRPYVGTAMLADPLEEFRVLIALTGSQVSMSLMPVAHDRLWLNGILVLATVVVALFAIGSSRREVMLARARSDFVAGVSHDLRMPLAQILLASETLALRRDRNEADRATLTASILREARRLKTMVENVLLFSRSGAVGLDPTLQAVDLGPLFTDVVESVELALSDAGQSIAVEVGDGVQVVADRSLLRQALVNVVDNAMKYGPRGQRITLRAEREGDRVRIIVEDEGPGIPAADRERLFEPYERLARDSTSERTGSGLGLAVAHQIIEACKGSIRIEDGLVGARIVMSLRAATA
jgi:signal transduction histidine kinase